MTERADVFAFIAKKQDQWERVSSAQVGLQLTRYGASKSTFMLVKSDEGFYEGVLIGQLPTVKRVSVQKGRRVHHREMREDEKPAERRAVDLDDEQSDDILYCWAEGNSALRLPFVSCAWNAEGEVLTKA